MLKRILIAIVFAMIPLIGISHAFTLTISSYNYYDGYYWGNPNEYSTSNNAGWSAGVNTGDSYVASGALDLSNPLTWNWGDNTQSTFQINTGAGVGLDAYDGSYTVNGVSYSDFNYCNVAPEYQSSANGYAQTMFSASNNNGFCVFQENHDYTSTGTYSVYLTGASPTAGSYQSNTISVAIISIQTPPAPTSSVTTSADAGSTLSLSGNFNCGSNTICPYVVLYYTYNSGSAYTSLSTTSLTTISGSYTYSSADQYQPVTAIYNPITSSTIVGSPLNVEIFPDLSTPTLSVSQSPSASNGLVIGEPITLTITVPQQNNGYATEPAPSGTINWGDGSSTSIASGSFSASGSNWVATVQHTYSSSSTYSISVSLQSYNYVTYGSSYGSTSSASISETINPYNLPTVSISPPSSNACGGSVSGIYNGLSGTYSFTLTAGSYPISTLTVNWGDGTTQTYSVSSSTTETHTYASSGSYTISAYATDSNGKQGATASTTITVQAFSKPSVSGISPTSATATQSTSFSVQVSKGTCPLNTITWSWGDGSGSNSASATAGTDTYSHTYQMSSTSGSGTETNSYTLTVTVTDNSGNSNSASQPISVSYTYPYVSSVSPTSVYNTPAGSSYNPTYSVTLGGGTNPLSSVQWNFGNGNTYTNSAVQGTNTQTNEYTTTGTYTVTVTATDTQGYSASSSTSVTVNPYPMPSIGNIYITYPSNGSIANTIYQGITFNYNVNVTQGGFALKNILWELNGTPINNGVANPANAVNGTNTFPITISNAGTYTVEAIVTDVNGASVSTSTTITVQNYTPPKISNFTIYPTANLNPQTLNGQINIVNGIATQFSVNLTEGSYPIQQLTWNFGDGTQAIINSTSTPALNSTGINYITHTFAQAGTYSIIVSAEDSEGQTISQQYPVVVSNYTNPSLSNFNPTAVILNQSNTYSITVGEGSFPVSSVVFNFNGVNVSVASVPKVGGIASASYTFNSSGYFPVTVYATDIYGNQTSQQYTVYSQQLPIITYFNYIPETNNSLYSQINTTFIVNITEGSNPLNSLTFYFGNGTASQVFHLNNASSVSLLINYTYPVGTYIAYFVVNDTNNNNETSPQLTFTISPYVTPQVISITPTSVYDVVNNTFFFNVSKGSFPLANVTIDWGDNSSLQVVDTNTSFYASHAYPLAPNTTYTIIAYAEDINQFETAFGQKINATYQLPVINSVSPTTVYATVPTTYTFNITQGTFPVSSIQVNFGNGNTPFVAITNTTPEINNTYKSAGTYTLSASVIDVNSQTSPEFTQTITVLPYVPPYISQLEPSTVQAGVPTNFTFTAIQGTFPLANLTINWGDGQIINYTNITNGTNTISFTYLSNNSFTVIEKQYDTFGVYSQNATLITALASPFSFTTPEPIINYTIQNSTSTPIYVQLNLTFQGNATLPVNYTVQLDNFISAYNCYPSISTSGLFGIYCSLNPSAINYPPETLYATVYATDSVGLTKAITETININTVIKPTPIAQPFNMNLTVATPPITQPYQPISADTIIFIMSIIIIFGSILVLIFSRR